RALCAVECGCRGIEARDHAAPASDKRLDCSRELVRYAGKVREHQRLIALEALRGQHLVGYHIERDVCFHQRAIPAANEIEISGVRLTAAVVVLRVTRENERDSGARSCALEILLPARLSLHDLPHRCKTAPIEEVRI